MRSSKNRSRGKQNRNRSSSGNNVNRVFDSSGPEGKVRGTPQQIIDKYQQLTRDAQLANDRVAAENFQQHAEHYTRLLGEAQREAEAKRAEQEAQQRDRQAQQQQQRNDREDTPRQQDPANAPQPDAAPLDVTSEGDSGLVETPETAPKPKRQRKPRAPKSEPQQNSDQNPDTPEAAE
ncbi:DUF4167 domain-containing protein [Aliiroseovarius sp. YM-037]|uniref:DUF4167 domain-containing protein n=1 Tax=Aliiroseovarius sp. YM-037 TaxID=3341728 RepID=UPI003A8121BE